MSTRDEAVRVARESVGGFAEDVVARLAAAGLLRPDPTGEDREVVLGLIKHHVNPAIGSLRRLDRDGGDTTAGFGFLNDAFEAATDAILSRSRGPETGQPAVTAEQVAAVVERVLLVDVAIRYGCTATIEDATARDRAMAERLVSEIVEGLGIEVRAGEDR